ncbi:MAG TPA: glycosyltransferase family 9 protein, partial [Vicinamibacterales bacterium]
MRILLVRLRLLGDVVFTTPLLRALRRRFPDAALTYVVEPLAAKVVHGNPHLHDVIVAPHTRGLTRLSTDIALAWQLRRRRFDIALDLHGGPRSAWLTWASGAPMRIGYAIKGRRWMYTTVVDRAPDLAPRHSVENQWDLLRPLGLDACNPVHDAVEMPDDAAAQARVTGRLVEAGVLPADPVILVHVSAGNAFRRWPAEAFADLVVGLVERDENRRVVVTAGPSEPQTARAICQAARARLGRRAAAVLDLGDFDPAELRALAHRASVYIGGDSGPLHVAATTHTPIVALLGPTLAERSGPW